MIQFLPKPSFSKDATLLFLTHAQVKTKKFINIPAKFKKDIVQLIQEKRFSGASGEIYPCQLGRTFILLVGLGKETSLTTRSLRIAVRKTLYSNFLKGLSSVEIIPHDPKEQLVVAIIEGVLIGTYSWNKYKTSNNKLKNPIKSVFLITDKKKSFQDAIDICEGASLTRDLINENADVATSSFIEKEVRKVIKGHKKASLIVLNKKDLQAKGLGLHLAVNQGSKNEPKLIIVKYQGASGKDPYTALVGKGMTFDTGGLNLKPSGHIETMRMDMSGAAAVIGSLKSVLSLKLKKNVLFVMSIAENLTGSSAYKPGDVICGYDGKTVEVANTDAEGRLVLADAIAYVVKNYKPKKLIDIATLTGACVVALGYDYTGLVAPDDKFARQLVRVSNETDDRVWRLPSYPELKDSVKSKIADIRNLGFPQGAGGTITAAEFLRQFAHGTNWAHLDIAGSAFVDGDERAYFGHGATGAGVRLLTYYLMRH